MGQQGSPITNEYKQTIVLIKEYFDRVRSDYKEQNLASVERTAHALEIGTATVKRVMAAHNSNSVLERTPSKRGRPPCAISDSLQTVTREFVRQSNREGRYITTEILREYLLTVKSEPIALRTLTRQLDRWGFTFGKGKRSQHLKEKDYVVACRQKYLRRKIANRKGPGVIRSEIYLDESYVNKNHSNDYIWYFDDDGPWIQKPTGKGERLIIINAMSASGWISGAKLVFASTRKTGDYHGQVNNSLFMKWFEEKLLINIPKNSLIIMDNAAYHNVLAAHSAPTVSCKKDRIRSWLEDYGIPLPEDCLKAEMCEILQKISPKPTYVVDEAAETHGHEILRTPPYHPELQPIETCWGIVKNHVARNCDFTVSTLKKQLEKGFDIVTNKTCEELIKKIRSVEDKFWRDDQLLDQQEG